MSVQLDKYGISSRKSPPSLPRLTRFAESLLKLIKYFGTPKSTHQCNTNFTVFIIYKSNKNMLVPVYKARSRSFYSINYTSALYTGVEKCNVINTKRNSTFHRSTSEIELEVKERNYRCLTKLIRSNQTVTLYNIYPYHKENFTNESTTRLIAPTDNDIRIMPKQSLANELIDRWMDHI